MESTDTPARPCTFARSADVLGDRWNLLVLHQAFLGTRRFDEFQAALGIGRNILSRRLSRLVGEGLLIRVEYQRRPPRYDYRLTQKGREVHPILTAMAAWGDRWLAGPGGPPQGSGATDARWSKGEELRQALELAAMFPARHAASLRFPPLPRRSAP